MFTNLRKGNICYSNVLNFIVFSQLPWSGYASQEFTQKIYFDDEIF